MHAGPSSLTRDRTRVPCIGSSECYPLDHQEVPIFDTLEVFLLKWFIIQPKAQYRSNLFCGEMVGGYWGEVVSLTQ